MNTCTLIIRESNPKQVVDTVRYYARKNIQVIGPEDDWREIRVTQRKLFGRNVLTIKRLDSAIAHDEFFALNQKMIDIFSRIDTPHSEVQKDLIGRIKRVKMTLSIQSSQELEAFWDLITSIARLTDGWIFWRGTALITDAGLTVLDTEGNSDMDNRDRPYLEDADEEEEEYEEEYEPLDPVERKAQTNDLLRYRGFPVSPELPPLKEEEEVRFRSPKEIIERATVLAALNQLAFEKFDAEEVWTYLSTYQLLPLLTPEEHTFLANPTEERRADETWKIEMIWVLMWALGVVEAMGFPEAQCNLNRILPTDYPFKGMEVDPRPFFEMPFKPRSPREVLDETDLYYRLDWAIMDAHQREEELEELHPVVVFERLAALRWLMHENAPE